MRASAHVRRVLDDEPWLTPRDIRKRVPDVKPGSLSTLLTTWWKEGLVARRKASRSYQYALRSS